MTMTNLATVAVPRLRTQWSPSVLLGDDDGTRMPNHNYIQPNVVAARRRVDAKQAAPPRGVPR